MLSLTDVVTILGDVHLGREFVTGVPLHRRGHRERMVWKQFEASLMDCPTPFHVQTGDLFNNFEVSTKLLLDVAMTYKNAAERNPGTNYVIYRGNHDASRDETKASSFDALAHLLEGTARVHVFLSPQLAWVGNFLLGFIPWHPFQSADQLATYLLRLKKEVAQIGDDKIFDAVFGHFDVESYGSENTHNLVPTKVLKDHTKAIYTGHIHKPAQMVIDGVPVYIVGSMQPYSHAEEPEPGTGLYETMDFEQYERIRQHQDVPDFDMSLVNIRVLVDKEEAQQIIPIECLSLITKLKKPTEVEEEEFETMDVQFENFDMRTIFEHCLVTSGVGPVVGEKILAKYGELKHV